MTAYTVVLSDGTEYGHIFDINRAITYYQMLKRNRFQNERIFLRIAR